MSKYGPTSTPGNISTKKVAPLPPKQRSKKEALLAKRALALHEVVASCRGCMTSEMKYALLGAVRALCAQAAKMED